MAELSASLLLVVPLLLIVLIALYLLRLGANSSEMTESSRQKFVGCGFLLLLIGLVLCAFLFVLGMNWLLKIVPLS